MSIPSTKDRNAPSDDMVEPTRQVTNMTLSPELFEQLYLAPKSKVKGQLRQTVGNPTPIALGGFLLSTTPLSMALLGWRGSGGVGGPAFVGAYFFLGGLMLLLGGIGEWVLGNTFPATVFSLFGGFWFTFGATLVPNFNAYGSYSTTGSPAGGLEAGQFYDTFAFFLVSMAVLSFVFLLASIRTNVIFVGIFLGLTCCFSCLSAAFFGVGAGSASALKLQHAGGGLLLVVSLLGWYIFLALVLASVDFPVALPLGDLSTVIRGKSASRSNRVSDAEKNA